MKMEKDELLNLLKDNLAIVLRTKWIGSQKQLIAEIRFDGELVSSDMETIEYEEDDYF